MNTEFLLSFFTISKKFQFQCHKMLLQIAGKTPQLDSQNTKAFS